MTVMPSVEDSTTFKVITITLLCILSVITIGINSNCMIIISKSKVLLKRPSTCLILNLLFVHLLQGLVVFPLYAAKKLNVNSILVKQVICDGFRFTYMITFYTAVISVLLIAVDRIIATQHVLHYRQIVTRNRVRMCTLLSWLYIVGLCLIPFARNDKLNKVSRKVRQNQTSENQSNNTYVITNANCHYIQSHTWTILMLVVNCIVPYFLIVAFYKVIVHNIHKIDKRSRSMTCIIYEPQKNKISNKDNADMQQNMKSFAFKSLQLNTGATTNDISSNEHQHQHKHITYLAIVLSVAYFFLWAPSTIYYILWNICPDKCFYKTYKTSNTESYISFTTKYLAFLDALAAPLIYCLYHKEFRKLVSLSKVLSTKTIMQETVSDFSK